MDALSPNFLSFVCLVTTTGFCLQAHVGSKESVFGALAYIILATHAILGAMQSFDSSKMPNFAIKAQTNIDLFIDSFVIAYSASELWTRRGIPEELVKLHLLIPLIPVFLYIFEKEYKKLNGYVMLGSMISFTIASFLNGCIYGIFTVFIYAANIYYVKKEVILDMIPPDDLTNYVYSLFCLFLLRTFHHCS